MIFCPEPVPISGTSSPFWGAICICPRRHGPTCGCTGVGSLEIAAWATDQLETATRKDGHWLEIGHDCRKQHQDCRSMLFPHASTPGLSTAPVNELDKVEHNCHHNGNLETVEEVHGTSAGASVHHRSTNVQHGRKDHRPTSGANDGRDGQTHCSHQNHHFTARYGFLFPFNCRNIRRWTSVCAIFFVGGHGLGQCRSFRDGIVQLCRHRYKTHL